MLAACGGAARTPPPVQLSLDSPGDGSTTLSSEVVVSGRVSPGAASVLVGGRSVPVLGGSFSTQVAVRPGSNVIDVLAGAPRARPAMSAVRIYRQILVAVPDLTGDSPSTASASLSSLGLSPSVQNVGGWVQSLIPAPLQVCRMDPPAGRQLVPGSTVWLEVAKVC